MRKIFRRKILFALIHEKKSKLTNEGQRNKAAIDIGREREREKTRTKNWRQTIYNEFHLKIFSSIDRLDTPTHITDTDTHTISSNCTHCI